MRIFRHVGIILLVIRVPEDWSGFRASAVSSEDGVLTSAQTSEYIDRPTEDTRDSDAASAQASSFELEVLAPSAVDLFSGLQFQVISKLHKLINMV